MNLILKLVSSPWFWIDVALSISGGIVVYWGLKVEKKAERYLPPSDFGKDIFDDILTLQKKELDRGWRILMTGIIMEVVAALLISVISGLEIADLQSKTAAANKLAGLANERASSNELARAELEKQIAPRRLSGEQRSKLIKFLSAMPSEKVVIVYGAMDSEAKDFANDFETAFKESGWEPFLIGNRLSTKYGVLVGVVSGTPLLGVKMLS